MEQKRQICSDEEIPDIVRGHEVWIEYDRHNISHGADVECKLCFGHNMKSERAVEIEKVRPTVCDARGKEYDAYVGLGGDHLLVRFTPEREGYHTLGVGYNSGILNLPHPGLEGPKYYQQYTKTIVPVGRPREDYDIVIGHELEIVPLDYRQYHVGDDILLKVLYAGHALAGATVYAIYVGNEDDPIEVQTDHHGRAAVELKNDGKWMFKVMHRDSEKSADLYDEKVMTATFTVMEMW